MDPGDPTSILFAKIKTLEPENASKIIGYLLLQDLCKRDLMRLALGPDTLLQSFCVKAKSDLGLSSNGSSMSPALSTISRPINIHRHSFSQSSPRMSRNGFLEFSRNNPSSPSLTSGSLNGNPNLSSSPFQTGSSLLGSSSVADYSGDASGSGDILDEHQLGDYFSFLNDSSSITDEGADPFWFSANNGDTHLHKRSLSASDACFGSEDLGFGGGYRFSHGGYGDNLDGNGGFGSPNKIDYVYHQPEEFMRMKAAHQQRMATATRFMASGFSPMPYDSGVNFPLHPRNAHRSGPGQFGKEGYWYGSPGRYEREDFLAMGMGDKPNSAARQIYLTFPADSTFKDEDVSNYFSNFGPVQDVRIPYQQKRMFGFVTFVHAETVRIILARGNPHFICDSRVLVKPYKEKGKIFDKRQQQLQQQQMERGKFSPCSSPSGIDSRDPFDCRLGPRMFCDTQEMIRRKAEQETVELQRRFMNLQLPDLKNESVHHHHHSLSVGSPVHFPSCFNQSVLLQSENICDKVTEDKNDTTEKHLQSDTEKKTFLSEEHGSNAETCNLNKGQETSLEDILPDTFFASPTKSTDTLQLESEKENCVPLSDIEEEKPTSWTHSA